MPVISTDDGRHTLLCGKQAIKLQETNHPHQPTAGHPTPGAADFCIIVKDPLDDVKNHLESYYVDIIEGPVERNGAHGKIKSIYINDPDHNLIEISEYY